ncbi:FAD-binding and (Fe-S)-binding domain-containing protein [Microbispora sp. CA-135349]|uniref:FAD-binding and (Fe-S)-binding domain-containing protein n=1 Tax=Microbispora sp. CA-135349 TaxID=3239953 RepID=UPI003D8E98D7
MTRVFPRPEPSAPSRAWPGAGEARNPPLPAYAVELRDRLGEAVAGEVGFGGGDRAMYAYDASVYRQVPIGVVTPRDAADVEAALEVCRRFGAPVLARGCGTSLTGQTVNGAVVFDFTRHMDRIAELTPLRRTARVQPGVICDELRDAAARYGLTFGPDPATHDHATIGGMVGNNSCGVHSVTAGKTVDNVEELEIVTYDGTRMRVGATGEDELECVIAAGGRRGAIYAGLRHIRDTYGDAIRRGLPDIPRRVSGYNLDALLPENGFHVARALVGSEGTLALTLDATCRLVRLPPFRALVVLGYPDIPSSGDDVPWLLRFGAIGLEFTSRHVVTNLQAKGFRLGGEDLLPPGRAWLLTEFGGETQREADARAARLVRAVRSRPHGPSCRFYDDPADETAVWEIRRHSAGTARMPVGLGGHGGWPNWEDAAVHPDVLGPYLRDFLRLLDRHGYDAVFYGHWGQGCVHSRIDFDLRSLGGVRAFRRFMEEAADLVVAYGGSLSGEHGDGHGRAELWPRMFPPELMRAFEEFKRVWDPDGRMNPHKLIDPYPLDAHLREGPAYRPRDLEHVFGYPLDGGSFTEAAGRCFGVGKCRHLSGGVMCPSFMVTREEKHSTRGRARLLQEMAESAGPVEGRWRSEAVREALDLCLACKGCRSDCPVQVDMATYKAEFLHHYYAGRPRPRQAYALGLIDVWARLASRVPRLANAVTHAPVLGRLAKLATGIAPERDAPRFARRTFRRLMAGHVPRNPGGPPVLLWPDTFTEHFQPEVGVAAVDVLESAGFHVIVPEGPLCCGRPLYDYGMLTLARRYLRRVLDAVGPLVEAGIPVVGLEPSCLAVFRDELTNLLPDDLDARRLHANSYLLSEFLTRHAPGWPLPRLRRRALVQVHCHHHAVMGFDAERALLRDMGLDVEIPDSGCCGMAGGFGYEAGEHYAVSMAAGERVLLPKVRAADPGTLIVADGFSCRGQITAGTGRRPLHLAQVLALAIREGELGPVGHTVDGAVGSAADHAAGDGGGGHRGLRALVAGGAGAAVAVAAALAARRRVRVPSRETHHGR